MSIRPQPSQLDREQLRNLGEPTDIEQLRRERDALAERVRALEHELGTVRGRAWGVSLMLWHRTQPLRRIQRNVERVVRAVRDARQRR